MRALRSFLVGVALALASAAPVSAAPAQDHVASLAITSGNLSAFVGGNYEVAQNRLQSRYYRAPWTPWNSGAVAAWWAAEDKFLMVDDGGGLISSWTGRRGLTVTATTTARPTWARNSFNSSYPGVSCDGVANAPTTTTLTSLPTGATAGEIWLVATTVSSGVSTSAVRYGGTTASSMRGLGKNTLDRPQVTDGTVTVADTASVLTAPRIMRGTFSGTTMLGYRDGTAFTGNPGVIASLNTGTTRLRLCANAAGSPGAFFAGVIADVVILTGVLSDADADRMFGYFAWKYGLQANLPATHPYRYAPP